jgi:uncharacterized protein (DUF736 family)
VYKGSSFATSLPAFVVVIRTTKIKTGWYWHKNKQEDQWIRIEDPDTNPRIYSQPIFDKGAKTRWRKDSLFNKCC